MNRSTPEGTGAMKSMQVKWAVERQSWGHQWLGLGLLVVVGVTLRLAFRDLPNFAPVAALALFAGYYFRSAVIAMLAPLGVMVLSDAVVGGYQWQMQVLVYAMLMFPVCLRGAMRRWCRPSWSTSRSLWRSAALPTLGLIGCGLLSSLAFFAVTNLGVWFFFNTYTPTWSGLVDCYAAAVPFFRYTLAGDLSFSVVFFGGFACARIWLERRAAAAELQAAA